MIQEFIKGDVKLCVKNSSVRLDIKMNYWKWKDFGYTW